jgi:hypothetical protein
MHRLPIALLTSVFLFGCGVPTSLASGSATSVKAKNSETLDPKFFARRDMQALMPEAFSLTTQSLPMLSALQSESQPKREALIQAIRRDPSLHQRIRGFATLNWDAQEAVLKQVFTLECRILGITPPELAFDTTLKGPAYFDFDLTRPGAGRVLLNPTELAKESNPYAALLLLIHETRHSAQLQLAFDPQRSGAYPAKGYRAAFEAQKKHSKQLNFSEFCSLHNEYEAFQFGNYVVGALTDWTVDTLDMGCFSSQFDKQGRLKIDLLAIAQTVGGDGLLDAFNERQKEQYRKLFAKP